jgi:hypothetical protein
MIRTTRIGKASQRNKLKALSHDGPRLGTSRLADGKRGTARPCGDHDLDEPSRARRRWA